MTAGETATSLDADHLRARGTAAAAVVEGVACRTVAHAAVLALFEDARRGVVELGPLRPVESLDPKERRDVTASLRGSPRALPANAGVGPYLTVLKDASPEGGSRALGGIALHGSSLRPNEAVRTEIGEGHEAHWPAVVWLHAEGEPRQLGAVVEIEGADDAKEGFPPRRPPFCGCNGGLDGVDLAEEDHQSPRHASGRGCVPSQDAARRQRSRDPHVERHRGPEM